MRKLSIIPLAIAASVALLACTKKSESQLVSEAFIDICQSHNVHVCASSDGYFTENFKKRADSGLTVALMAEEVSHHIDSLTQCVGDTIDVHHRFNSPIFLSVTKQWDTPASLIKVTLDTNQVDGSGDLRIAITDKTKSDATK